MSQSTSMRPAELIPFEGQIESFEQDAQEKYHTAIQNMETVVLSDRFKRLLEFRIIPTLERIGFDEQLCWVFFKMTAPAWKLIEQVGVDIELMYPVLQKNIEEIRMGIISDSRKKIQARSILAGMDPQATYSLIDRTMHPVNFFEDCYDISLSWIMLPRAYDLLEENHSRCILIYIKHFDKEMEIAFTKIMARIITEFMSNYSLKYINDSRLRDQAVNALFYGYAAMFWKNLRNPPNGLEDGLIFENFYRCAERIHGRFASTNRDMARTTGRMAEEKEKIFPIYNAFNLAHCNHCDAHRSFVALRHGIPGVDSVVRHFGIGSPILEGKTDGRLPYVAVPKTLNRLFRQIKKRHHLETSRTKKSILEFLRRLRSNYNLKRTKTAFSGSEPPETLRFIGPRVCTMIQDLVASINLTSAQ